MALLTLDKGPSAIPVSADCCLNLAAPAAKDVCLPTGAAPPPHIQVSHLRCKHTRLRPPHIPTYRVLSRAYTAMQRSGARHKLSLPSQSGQLLANARFYTARSGGACTLLLLSSELTNLSGD